MKRVLQIALGIILAVVILAGSVMYYVRPGGPYDQRLKQAEVELQQAQVRSLKSIILGKSP